MAQADGLEGQGLASFVFARDEHGCGVRCGCEGLR